MVLQVLYDSIQDKSKILTGKRITSVSLADNSATAITADDVGNLQESEGHICFEDELFSNGYCRPYISRIDTRTNT